MYRDEVPLIAAYVRQSPENLADCLTFVLLSIRVQFGRVPGQMAEVRREGRDASSLWGWKQDGFEYIQANKSRLWRDAFNTPTIDCVDLFAASVPGLAIVKSAFVAQMIGHNVACFDSRNMEALGYETGERPWRLAKKEKPINRQRKIAEYVDATLRSGGAEHWWNNWCEGIAPGLGSTGDLVSQLHWKIIAGKDHKRKAQLLRQEVDYLDQVLKIAEHKAPRFPLPAEEEIPF